ncbi:MAG TPA: hypothetical protein VK634_10810, partial [Reyranella sp.]|nr:hypothetical protein [Reyranella sp.]
TFLLCESQVLQKPVLYLSLYLKRHRQTYYELLQATRDRGAWEEWLAFFLRGVADVSAQAADTARRMDELLEGIEAAGQLVDRRRDVDGVAGPRAADP